MDRRAYGLLVAVAIGMGIVAIVVSHVTDEPLRDPDGFLGPAYFRMPGMVVAAFALDVVPRALWRARGRLSRFRVEAGTIIRTHWTRERLAVVAVGLVSFYVTYVSYRNLKNGLLVYRKETHDGLLHDIDHWLLFGHDPAIVLHQLLGESWSAQILAAAYILFLPVAPLTVAAWLVWAKLPQAIWYVTANCLCWTFGTLSYYAIPSLGPDFQYPWLYKDIDQTAVKKLQDGLWDGRYSIYFNPFADGVQSVAGFASLHIGIILCVALITHYTVPWKPVRIGVWVYFVLTAFSTIYFGWHYLADDIAGAVIAIASVYIAGKATGHRFERRGLVAIPPEPAREPALSSTN